MYSLRHILKLATNCLRQWKASAGRRGWRSFTRQFVCTVVEIDEEIIITWPRWLTCQGARFGTHEMLQAHCEHSVVHATAAGSLQLLHTVQAARRIHRCRKAALFGVSDSQQYAMKF